MTGWYPYVTDWATPKSKQQDEEKKQRNNYGVLYNQQQNLKAKNDPGAQLLGMINDTLGATATVLKYNKQRQDKIKEETILDLQRLQAEKGWDVEQQKKWRGQIEELEKEGGEFETFIKKLKKTNLPLANYLEKNGPKRILHVKRAFALDKAQNAENILQAHLADETIQDHGRTNLEYYNSLESTTAKQDYRYKVVAAEFKGGTTHKGVLFDDVIPELKKWSKVKEIKETATQNKGIITANIKAQDDEIFGLLSAAEANAGNFDPAAKRIEENISSIMASIDENSSEFTTSGLTKRQYATEIFAERFLNHIRGGLRADGSRISINSITGLYNATSESFKINGKQVTFGQLLMYDNSSLSLNNLLKAAETGAKASLKIQREGIEAEGNAALDEYQVQCQNKGGCTVEEITQFAGEIARKFGVERESFNRLGNADQSTDAYIAASLNWKTALQSTNTKELEKALKSGKITNEAFKKQAQEHVNHVNKVKGELETSGGYDLKPIEQTVAGDTSLLKGIAGFNFPNESAVVVAELKQMADAKFLEYSKLPNTSAATALSMARTEALKYYNEQKANPNGRYYIENNKFNNITKTEDQDVLGRDEVKKEANETNIKDWDRDVITRFDSPEMKKYNSENRKKAIMSDTNLLGENGYNDLIGMQEMNQFSKELIYKARALGVSPGELYTAQIKAFEELAKKDPVIQQIIDLQKVDTSGRWEASLNNVEQVYTAAKEHPNIQFKLVYHGWEALSEQERLILLQTVEAGQLARVPETADDVLNPQMDQLISEEADAKKAQEEQDRIVDQIITNEEQKGPSLADAPTDTTPVDPTGMFDDSNREETDEELAIKDQEYREQGLF